MSNAHEIRVWDNGQSVLHAPSEEKVHEIDSLSLRGELCTRLANPVSYYRDLS